MLEIILFFSYINIRNVINVFCFLVIEIFIEMLAIFLFFSYRNIRNVSYIYIEMLEILELVLVR